ncbi:MAG TPA: hypothetical protein VIN09_08920 [Chloroflexota bacterium]
MALDTHVEVELIKLANEYVKEARQGVQPGPDADSRLKEYLRLFDVAYRGLVKTVEEAEL